MAKIIIDANIIISAAFGGKLLEAAVIALNKHSVYLSKEIVQEFRTVFTSLSKELTEEQLAAINKKMDELIAHAKLVEVNESVTLSRDAADDHYLSLCKTIGSDFLVTGDKDLLCIEKHMLKKEGIDTSIVNPREFLEEQTSLS